MPITKNPSELRTYKVTMTPIRKMNADIQIYEDVERLVPARNREEAIKIARRESRENEGDYRVSFTYTAKLYREPE